MDYIELHNNESEKYVLVFEKCKTLNYYALARFKKM
jgi:hypothetical protein